MMRETKNIFYAATLTGIIIFNAAWAEEIRPGHRDRQVINYITSVNIKTPKGYVYRRGESLPIVIEIQNKSSFDLPFREINGLKNFRITYANGSVIGEGSLWNHIWPWEYTDGFLKPAQTISDTIYFERLRYRTRGQLPPNINIQFAAPIQEFGRGRERGIKYTYGIPIELRDEPFEYTLVSDDLPENWTQDMDIFLQEAGGISYRYSAIHIDGAGRVTTIGSGIRDVNFPIKAGRNEFKCSTGELNGIITQLRNFKIERLNDYDSDRQVPDGITMSITISKGSRVFCGNYPGFSKEVRDLRQIITSLINEDY